MNDLHSSMAARRVIAPIAIGANATKTGKIIDRQGYGGLEFLVSYGAIATSGTIVTVVCLEGDVTGTLTSVADADLLGTEALASRAAAALASGSTINVTKKLGYKGSKRYVQVRTISTGTTSVGCVSVEAILFNPMVAPTANPAAAQ